MPRWFVQACCKMRFKKTHFLVKQTWIVIHWCQIWSEKTFFAKNAFEVFFFFMTTYISAALAVLLKEIIYLCFRKQSKYYEQLFWKSLTSSLMDLLINEKTRILRMLSRGSPIIIIFVILFSVTFSFPNYTCI